MDTVMLWCGFAGAWLLVAGPIYQAALELKDQDIESDRIREMGANVQRLPTISPWWWLLPPVKIYLERRRSRHYRQAYIAALTSEDVEALISFMSKTTGWLFVAAGGLLLAVKETHDCAESYAWPTYVFIALAVGMTLLCLLNTIFRISRGQRMITEAKKRP